MVSPSDTLKSEIQAAEAEGDIEGEIGGYSKSNSAWEISTHMKINHRGEVNQLNMTKSALINQINASEGGTLSESRAERVWNTFNLSLHSGAITFLDNGTMQFSMPLTHHAAAYGVPDVACDLIEEMFLRMRSVYASRVPRKIRRRLEARLEYAADSGLIYGLVAIFGTLLLVDIATSTFDVTRSGAAAVAKKED